MKRLLAVILTLVLMLAVLTGCGAQSAPAAEVPAQESVPQESATLEEKTEPVTLTVFAGTAAYEETIAKLTEDYFNETGVTIEWEIGGEDFASVLKTRIASGEAPDIFDVIGSFESWGERLADVSDMKFIEHAFDSSMEPALYEGTYRGVPYAFEGSGFIYNKDLFEKAGITELPKTLDDLEEACKKLQAAGIQPFGEAWAEWGFLMHIFGTPFAYEGDTAELQEKLVSGNEKLAEMKYMDNFFRLYDMTLDYGFGEESVGYSVLNQYVDFAEGKMAMIKQGTWLNDMILTVNPDINMGLMAVPLSNDPAECKLMTDTSRYFGISKDSEYIDEAKAFLDWFVENIQTYIVDALGVMAPYDTINTDNISILNNDMFAYADEGMSYPTFGNLYWPTGLEIDVATPLQAYAAGAIDKEECLAQLQDLYNSRVASN